MPEGQGLGKYFGESAVRRLANACNGGGWDEHMYTVSTVQPTTPQMAIAPPRKRPAYSGAAPVGLSDLGTDIIHHIAMVSSVRVSSGDDPSALCSPPSPPHKLPFQLPLSYFGGNQGCIANLAGVAAEL
jgi:hypothetical protein